MLSSSCGLNGRPIKSSAPASMAFTLSWSPLEVSMITGRRRVAAILAEAPAHVVPGHVGHEDVQKHEVRVLGVQLLQSLTAGGSHRERVSVRREHRLEQAGVLRRVVDHQEARRSIHHPPTSAWLQYAST